MDSKWNIFSDTGPLPAERRYVLLAIPATDRDTPCVVMGYLRYSSGDLHCPCFITPGSRPGDDPTHWIDCLGDDFRPPGFESSARQHGFPAFDIDELAAARGQQHADRYAPENE